MKTTRLPSLTWNLVTKNFRAHEQLQGKLRQKLTKLERHLQRFPRDAVHLQVALEKHPQKNLFAAALVLRVPSNILRSERRAPDPVPALDQATKALLRQLSGFKTHLRREPLWKRKARRAELHAAKATRFAATAMADGAGPQTGSDVLRALIEQNHARLLRYVRRHLWHDAALGRIPRGAIDAPAVVGEVARRALAASENKPAELGFLLWFYVLAQKELLEQSQKIANNWPKPEREAFELYFVEGFEPEEIGMVLGLSTKSANELLTSIRARVRDTLLAQSAV